MVGDGAAGRHSVGTQLWVPRLESQVIKPEMEMPFSKETPTQSAATKKVYLRDPVAREAVTTSGRGIAGAGHMSFGSVPRTTLVIIVVAAFLTMSHLLRGKARSTIRKHIAAICHFISKLADVPTAVEVSGALYEAARSHNLFDGASEKRTSARKRKSFSGDAIQRLFKALRKGIDDCYVTGTRVVPDGGWSDLLFTWALCLILYYTGARPIEVGTMRCYFYGNLVLFKIRNAKHTNGRAHGVYRIVGYADLGEAELADLELAWAIIRRARNCGHPNPWRYLLRVAARVLKREVRAMFGASLRSNYTLYTFRHQLFADLKHAGFGFVEIAAIAGHSVTKTVFVHYAKRRVGRTRSNLPFANPAETAKIKQNYKPLGSQKQAPVVTPPFGKL